MASHVHGYSLMSGWRARLERLAERSGRINLVVIILILAVAAVAYAAVVFIPPYIEYYKLEEKIRSVANMAHREKDDGVLLKELIRESQILGLDLPYDAFSIQRDPQGKWIEFSVRWARVVELVPLGQEVSLHFDIQVVEQL